MVIRKRQLLWDWTNSSGPGNPGVPQEMNLVPFGGNSPMASVVNWNAWVPPELKGRAPFRPMVHGLSNTTGNDWNTIQSTPYPVILFLNEPERAGITPEHARDIWYKQMLPLRHNKAKKLGSPAVAGDAAGDKWLQEWMNLVAKDPPDYLCVHYYSTSGDAAINFIRDRHKKYPAHPIMVTEIASIDRNYHNVLNFTIQVCNWMDQQDFIFEYGLFDFQRKPADGFVSPAAQLMDPKGNFTQLGNMYLHDQPMKFPTNPHAVEHRVAQPEHAPIAPPTPTPPLHGSEDEPVHALQTNGDHTNGDVHLNGVNGVNGTDHPVMHMAVQADVNLNSDQAEALKLHNDGRKAKGLRPLVWDAQLASHAETWAKHLVQINKMVHSTGQQRPGEGENLAWAWNSAGTPNPLTGGAKMWMNEAKDYHGEPIGQGNFEAYGHYTQCMWSSTTKVGVAFAKTANGAAYTVGRYSPPGNWTGQKPY